MDKAAPELALREFLLAVEHSKRSLDTPIVALAEYFASGEENASIIAEKLLEFHPQCEPLLDVWPTKHGANTRWEKRSSIDAFLQVTAHLLQKLSETRLVDAEAFAYRIISEKSSSLEKMLTWSDLPIIEFRVIKLMTTIVHVSDATAREFVRVFNFQSNSFVKLAGRRQKHAETKPTEENEDKEEEEEEEPKAPSFQIREAYVEFVIALVMNNDKSVHRFALRDGGLVSTLFKSMDGDTAKTLDSIFSTLTTAVLDNKQMDMRAKRSLFNKQAVQQLVKNLLSSEDEVAQVTSHMLDTLFLQPRALFVVSSEKATGILLHTSATKSTSEEGNVTNMTAASMQMVRSTLNMLNWNDVVQSSYAQAFILRVVQTYPAILGDYLNTLSTFIEPKGDFKWFATATFIQKMLSTPMDNLVRAFKNKQELPTWCTADIVASRLIAPMNWRKELSRGVQHSNNLVVYSTLGIICTILGRYNVVVARLQAVGASEVLSGVENGVRALLPSAEALVSLLTKLCASVEGSELLYWRALSVFRSYLTHLPHATQEAKVDFSKLLAWSFFHAPSDKPIVNAIVGEMLHFLSIVPPSRLFFLYSKSSKGSSQLCQLLHMCVSSPVVEIQRLCNQVLQRALVSSGAFGRSDSRASGRAEKEVKRWMEALQKGDDKCAELVETLVQNARSDPLQYVNWFYRIQTQHNRGTDATELVVSPMTIALVKFLQTSAEEVAISVEAFAVSVLNVELVSCDRPEQLALVIAGGETVGDETTDDGGGSKKRKRETETSAVGNQAHGYQQLRHCCNQICEFASESTSKKSKVRKSKVASKWSQHASNEEFQKDLHALDEETFKKCIVDILHDFSSTKSRMPIVETYLSTRFDVDVLEAHRQTNDKKEQTALRRVIKQIHLPVLAQCSLLRACDSKKVEEEYRKSVLELHDMVSRQQKQKILEMEDAARICDQAIFALTQFDWSNRSTEANASLCALLLDVGLSVIFTSDRSMSDALLTRMKRSREYIVNGSVQASKKQAQLQRLLGVELCWLQVRGDAQALQEMYMDGANVAMVATLSRLLPISSRLRVLDCVLQEEQTSPVGMTLAKRLIQSLYADGKAASKDMEKFGSKESLRQRVWTLVSDMKASDLTSKEYIGILSVLASLGGVDAATLCQSISSTTMPLALNASLNPSDDVDGVKVLQYVLAAVNASSVEDGSTQTLVDSLRASLDDRICSTKGREMPTYLTMYYRVFGAPQSTDLTLVAKRITQEAVNSILSGEADKLSLDCVYFAAQFSQSNMVSPTLTFQKLLEIKADSKMLTQVQLTILLLIARRGEWNSSDEELYSFMNYLLECRFTAVDSFLNGQKDKAHCKQLLKGISILLQCILEKVKGTYTNPTVLSLERILDAIRLSDQLSEFEMIMLYLNDVLRYSNAKNLVETDAGELLSTLLDHKCLQSALETKTTKLVTLQVIVQLMRVTATHQERVFKLLLSLYSMSLSSWDRLLFGIMQELIAGADDLSFKKFSFRFHDHIQPTLSTKSGKMNVKAEAEWLLGEALESVRIRATVDNFPLEREVHGQVEVDDLLFDDTLLVEEEEVESYDPAFLLPMLAHFVTAADVSSTKFVQQGMLGIALRATSSKATSMREYGYGIVAHFHEVLAKDNGEFKAGRQVHLALDTLRNGVSQSLEQIPSIVSVFLNDAASILCRPAHVMYPLLNRFFLSKPALNVAEVPMFFSLFNSYTPQTSKQERSWLLHVLRRGMCDDTDAELLGQRRIYSVMMSFFASELADVHAQLLVGRILCQALKTVEGAAELLEKASILAWIGTQVLRLKNRVNATILPLLVEMLEIAMNAINEIEMDSEQQRALELHAINAFLAVCEVPDASHGDSEEFKTKRAHIAKTIVLNMAPKCPLWVMQKLLDASDKDVALALVINLDVAHHPDFNASFCPSWSKLLCQAILSVSNGDGHESPPKTRDTWTAALTAFQRILDASPDLKVLVVSDLQRENPGTVASVLTA